MYYSKKHEELMDAWVAHEAAGAPDDYYAEHLLSQLDLYDKIQGLPLRQRSMNKFEQDKELSKQSRQIQYEADARAGFPFGPSPKVF